MAPIFFFLFFLKKFEKIEKPGFFRAKFFLHCTLSLILGLTTKHIGLNLSFFPQFLIQTRLNWNFEANYHGKGFFKNQFHRCEIFDFSPLIPSQQEKNILVCSISFAQLVYFLREVCLLFNF